MNKIQKLVSLTIILAFVVPFAGTASSLSAQTAPVQAKSEVQQVSDQSKAEAQAQDKKRAEQEKAILEAQRRIEQEREKAAAERAEMEAVIKTYALKYINASDFMRSAKFYVYESAGTESSLTVRIPKKNIPDFEALLKKLDVEKKNIQFQVYTIVASKEAPLERLKSNFVTETREISNQDLKRVLDEMKGLWNFKYYWVDSPSFIVVKDGAEGSSSKLAGLYDFDLRLRNVQLRGDEAGKRIVAVSQISLTQTTTQRSSLIDTSDITFKEKGYLVVGVSGFNAGWSGSALILVISAEIK